MSDMDAPSGGSEYPEGYDADTMGDIATPEEFENAQPFQKDRFSRFARKNRELKARLEAEQQERMALAGRLGALEANINKAPEPKAEGLAGLPEEELRAWKAKALATQQAFMADPTNDELKAQFQSIKPEHLIAVDEELMDRKASKARQSALEEVNGRFDGQARQTSFEQTIGSKYGLEYVRKGTPEYQAALAEFADLARDFNVTRDNTDAFTLLAIERAKMKAAGNNRDGRAMNDNERRRLAIEGQGRREAQPGNQVAALLAKGDWKSRGKAVDMQINDFLKSHFGS